MIFQIAQAASVGVNTSNKSIEQMILNIFSGIVIPTISALAVAAIIYAGVLYLMSQGDPDKLKKAKSALLWPIVGAVLIVLSISIVVVLQSVVNKNLI